VPKYAGRRVGEWKSWAGPLPAAAAGLNFVTRSGVGFTHGSQIKPMPAPKIVRSGSGRSHGCKIESTPTPIGSKTRWSLEPEP
jgi:hypothetical protein